MAVRQQALAGLLLALFAALLLWLGLTSPSIEFKRFFFLTDRHSILSVISGLWAEGETLLALILALFSVAFPVLKIASLTLAGLLMAIRRKRAHRTLALSSALGRWSMLDVLVLALVIFYVKNSGIADATSLPGIWYFAASVVTTMMAAFILSKDRGK